MHDCTHAHSHSFSLLLFYPYTRFSIPTLNGCTCMYLCIFLCQICPLTLELNPYLVEILVLYFVHLICVAANKSSGWAIYGGKWKALQIYECPFSLLFNMRIRITLTYKICLIFSLFNFWEISIYNLNLLGGVERRSFIQNSRINNWLVNLAN